MALPKYSDFYKPIMKRLMDGEVYSTKEMVHAFIQDVYRFEENNRDLGLNRYQDILNEHGIEWNNQSMSEADVSNLNGQCVMALVMGAVRAERFCDGALLEFFQNGSILRWLQRLEEIE